MTIKMITGVFSGAGVRQWAASNQHRRDHTLRSIFSIQIRQMRWLVIFLTLGLSACTESNPEAEATGAVAATQWLALIDQSDYDASWQQSAALFRNQVSSDDWQSMAAGVRQPLGMLVHRTVIDTQYATNLPAVPDGEYVVVTFETEFSNKKQAVETVTVSKTQQDDWAVAGYFVR